MRGGGAGGGTGDTGGRIGGGGRFLTGAALICFVGEAEFFEFEGDLVFVGGHEEAEVEALFQIRLIGGGNWILRQLSHTVAENGATIGTCAMTRNRIRACGA